MSRFSPRASEVFDRVTHPFNACAFMRALCHVTMIGPVCMRLHGRVGASVCVEGNVSGESDRGLKKQRRFRVGPEEHQLHPKF